MEVNQSEIYEPTFKLESSFTLKLDSNRLPNPNDRYHKVGALNFETILRCHRIGGYELRIRCQPKDPHWYCKFECAFRVKIDEDPELWSTTCYEASASKKVFYAGPFGTVKQGSTNHVCVMDVNFKIIDSSCLHHPMLFDFTKKTELSDASIEVNEIRFYVTKCILEMQSGYFKREFSKAKKNEITVSSVTADEMRAFLELIYPHTHNVKHRVGTILNNTKEMNLDRMLELAHTLECPSVIALIQERIMTRKNDKTQDYLHLADKYQLSHVCSRELAKLQSRNDYQSLLNKKNFSELSEELRSDIMSKMIAIPESPNQASGSLSSVQHSASASHSPAKKRKIIRPHGLLPSRYPGHAPSGSSSSDHPIPTGNASPISHSIS